ncbi:MAG: hypothetical protein ACI8VW_002264 [bacterium]|jgi:hypothetical protein
MIVFSCESSLEQQTFISVMRTSIAFNTVAVVKNVPEKSLNIQSSHVY